MKGPQDVGLLGFDRNKGKCKSRMVLYYSSCRSNVIVTLIHVCLVELGERQQKGCTGVFRRVRLLNGARSDNGTRPVALSIGRVRWLRD